jgi:ABC-2 type transport system ATP-binding protein
LIEVKNLTKRYGNQLAVNNLSFTVEKGQVLGFLGPNGAGKTTTMNIITGYISATEGTVTINGVDVFEEPEAVKKMIGYLPEFPPLYPEMTVREYLNFAADLKKVPKSEKKEMVMKVMDSTMITPMADRLIKHLSKGYKQRVGLAQAILGYPELIILDEPTVGLDPKQIIEIRDLIKELSKNHTVILSSHIMQEVSAVCDMVMIIDKGKLILRDKPENLSTQLGSTGGLKLSVKGSRETIHSALSKISRVNRIEVHEAVDDEIVELTLHCSEKDDIREEVFYAMSEARTPILEMQSIRMSLEDIFLKVTGSSESGFSETDVEETAENKAIDSKVIDSKAIDGKAIDGKAIDSKGIDSKATDLKTETVHEDIVDTQKQEVESNAGNL